MKIISTAFSKIIWFLVAIVLTFTTPLNAKNKDVYDPGSFPQIDAEQKADDSVRIVSFNVRNGTVNGEPEVTRYYLVADEIIKLDPDSAGLQEVTPVWKDQLTNKLSDKYGFVGDARDGENEGEYSLIIYKKDSYNLLDSGTFWLSETPDEISMGWDAVCNRVCTYAKLQDKATGKIFVHMNTHLDHKGKDARKNGAKLITDFIDANFKDLPVVLTGDFNSLPFSAAYNTIVKSGLKDAKFTAQSRESYGTYHDAKPIINGWYTIDYIFTSANIDTLVYKTVTVGVNNRFVSDHFPVYADIKF